MLHYIRLPYKRSVVYYYSMITRTYKFYFRVRQVPHGRQIVLEQLGIPLPFEQLRQDAEATRLDDAHFVVRARRQNCMTGGIWEIIWYYSKSRIKSRPGCTACTTPNLWSPLLLVTVQKAVDLPTWDALYCSLRLRYR